MDSAHFVQETYHAQDLSSTGPICFWPKVMNSAVVTRLPEHFHTVLLCVMM